MEDDCVAGLPEAFKPSITSLQVVSHIDCFAIDLEAGGATPGGNPQPQGEGGGLRRSYLDIYRSLPGVVRFLMQGYRLAADREVHRTLNIEMDDSLGFALGIDIFAQRAKEA